LVVEDIKQENKKVVNELKSVVWNMQRQNTEISNQNAQLQDQLAQSLGAIQILLQTKTENNVTNVSTRHLNEITNLKDIRLNVNRY